MLTLSTAASSTEFAKAVGDKFFNSGPTTKQLGHGAGEVRARQGLEATPTWSSTRASPTSPSRSRRTRETYRGRRRQDRRHRQGRLAERQVRLQLDGLEDQVGEPAARRDQRADDLPADRLVREAAARRRHRHAGARQRDAADPRAAEARRARPAPTTSTTRRRSTSRARAMDPKTDPDDRPSSPRTTRPSSATSPSRPTARAPTRR